MNSSIDLILICRIILRKYKILSMTTLHNLAGIEAVEKKAILIAENLKFLSHPKRLMILCQLSTGSKSVGELEKACGISQSQLSQFLTKMKDQNILQCEKTGLFVHYSIKDEPTKKLLESLAGIYCKP